MAPYSTTLPQCFPHAIQVPVHSTESILRMLVSASESHQNGSSFAVTSDGPRGYRRIWLSDASYRSLVDSHTIPDMYPSWSTKEEAH
jgi:hypothetical protein